MSRLKDRQEKFAQDNLEGLDQMKDKIHDLIAEFKKEGKTITKSSSIDNAKLDAIVTDLETILTIMSLKLSNATGHALNAKSTKYIRKIIYFLDECGISDEVIHPTMMTTVSKRLGKGTIYEMALVLAAIVGDFKLIKEIFELTEKNKNRKNIFKDVYRLDYNILNFGNFSNMVDISNLGRIAFEAVLHGREEIFEFLKTKTEFDTDMIKKYIENDYRRRSLNVEEAENAIIILPELIDHMLKHSPMLVPESVRDIFIF